METNKSGNKQTRIDDRQGMLVGGLIFEEIRTTEALKSLPVWQIDHATNHFAEDKVRTILVNIGSMFDGDELAEEQKVALDFLRQTYLLCNEKEVTLDNLFDDIIPLYFERFEQMLNTGKPIVEIKQFERSIDNLRLFTNDIKIEVDGKLYGIDDNCNEILQQIKIDLYG